MNYERLKGKSLLKIIEMVLVLEILRSVFRDDLVRNNLLIQLILKRYSVFNSFCNSVIRNAIVLTYSQ